jgi:hypothetical protein
MDEDDDENGEDDVLQPGTQTAKHRGCVKRTMRLYNHTCGVIVSYSCAHGCMVIP